VLTGSQHALEHGTSRPGRWLQARRVRFALWIAAAEGILVIFSHATTKWTVIVLAVVAVMAWLGGRDNRSDVVRQVLWIFAASQLLAVITVVLALIVKGAVIAAVVVFAIVGLVYLFLDRR
jgi:predicted membrane protein